MESLINIAFDLINILIGIEFATGFGINPSAPFMIVEQPTFDLFHILFGLMNLCYFVSNTTEFNPPEYILRGYGIGLIICIYYGVLDRPACIFSVACIGFNIMWDYNNKLSVYFKEWHEAQHGKID